jgi:glutaconate CoA-transferase subunit A
MATSKLSSLKDAILNHVENGFSVVMGTCLETMIPFAAGRELIRSGKKNLTLIGPISDILFDQLVGGGCVRKIRAAWVGNVITGSGYNFRRAVENGSLAVEDHTNLTISTALYAGAMGVSFMPVKTALGSDLLKTNPSLKPFACPFTGEIHVAVRAIRPDVAIVHVQRADEYGGAHMWSNMGITREACLSADKVIFIAERIVSSDQIRSDCNRVLIPPYKVAAVVHYPWGAHPSPVPGFYNRDHQAFLDYRESSKNPNDFEKWRQKWVDNAPASEDYRSLLGEDRMNALQLKRHLYSEPVDYGY